MSLTGPSTGSVGRSYPLRWFLGSGCLVEGNLRPIAALLRQGSRVGEDAQVQTSGYQIYRLPCMAPVAVTELVPREITAQSRRKSPLLGGRPSRLPLATTFTTSSSSIVWRDMRQPCRRQTMAPATQPLRSSQGPRRGLFPSRPPHPGFILMGAGPDIQSQGSHRGRIWRLQHTSLI